MQMRCRHAAQDVRISGGDPSLGAGHRGHGQHNMPSREAYPGYTPAPPGAVAQHGGVRPDQGAYQYAPYQNAAYPTYQQNGPYGSYMYQQGASGPNVPYGK